MNSISIHGARQNNLKGFDLTIPLNKLTVVTGVSGSGKSSLAFDTVYAEGQRRYVETFSSYARQFLDRMDKPRVDRIDGIPPAIAIDQTNPVRTSRSTVGTMTELNDHFKLLFARTARLYCRECKAPVHNDTAQSIAEELLKTYGNRRVQIVFSVPIPQNFTENEIRMLLAAQGYVRLLSTTPHAITVIQDRLIIGAAERSRIVEDLESCFKHGAKAAAIYPDTPDSQPLARYSAGLHCPTCDIAYTAPSQHFFSFNSPLGACDTCRGFGRTIGVDYRLVVPDESKTLAQGAIKPFQSPSYHECQDDLVRFAKKRAIPLTKPWRELTPAQQNWVLEGEGEWDQKVWYGVKRFFEWMESRAYKMHVRVFLSRYRAYHECSACNGARLKPEALLWRVGSGKGRSLHELMLTPICDLADFFNQPEWNTSPKSRSAQTEAADTVLREIRTRIAYLVEVGLGYLTLDRQSRTLSGGEVQRINLTTALGTSLVNTLFVLDEPSIGLHPRDIGRLTSILKRLRDAGNTLLVVEHDPDLIAAADNIIDMGPGPGEHGGSIVFSGPFDKLLKCAQSQTGAYFAQTSASSAPTLPVKIQKKGRGTFLTITNAREHNLKSVTVQVPLGALVCVTGVSGSGKSTLVNDILFNTLSSHLGRSAEAPGACDSISGMEQVDDIVMVDQSSIGRTSRGNPASYTGAFDAIRGRFVRSPGAKERAYTAGTFSFNSGTGRCPTCNGSGFEHVEMQFLSDVYLRCPDCNGLRYRSEILEITIPPSNPDSTESEKNIAQVLDMTVSQAMDFFGSNKQIATALAPLVDVGLGYIRLGQPLPTLSGGEAQRLKLAAYLAQKRKGRTLFLFDEPTTGLHFSDTAVLLVALQRLVEQGDSVVVIEHNIDIIAAADWIIDLGPEGGDRGGEIVCEGTVETVRTCKASHTGAALRRSSAQRLPQNVVKPVRKGAKAVEHNTPESNAICLTNAREHNLKGISLSIPRDAFTVITGVSGSGKSTIAFDILFAEGQRRYLESLNAYARQFVQPASRPDIDSVSGLPPTVAIEQRTSRGGRKSTVATVTELYHFLRLLYVKLGTQLCPDCHIPIEPQTPEQIVARLLHDYAGRKATLYAPLVSARKGLYNDLAAWALSKGYDNLRVDNELMPTAQWPRLDRFREHTIDLPLGSLSLTAQSEPELRKSVDEGLSAGKQRVIVAIAKKGKGSAQELLFSTARSCTGCGRSFDEPDPRMFSYNSKHGWCPACFGTGLELSGFDQEQTGEEIWWNDWFDGVEKTCKTCGGARLRPESLAVQLDNRSIAELAALSVEQAIAHFASLNWSGRRGEIGNDLIAELRSRLSFLQQVGLGYLTLDRAAPTLSGGEAQRIRLAAQLGSNLQGVCYILDEPTIGLHSRDNARLLDTLGALGAKGNTIVVVEHDEETIRRADHIIDLGPGGGVMGGQIIGSGTASDLETNPRSITGACLRTPLPHPQQPRRAVGRTTPVLTVNKADLHNLKNISVKFPLGRLIGVSGVSGSGKSTLVRDILHDNLAPRLTKAPGAKTGGSHWVGSQSIEGFEPLSRIMEVDQRPIGRTPRSCPATYVGIWDGIRKLFATAPEALMRGYGPSRFSFNVAQGRCAACDGQGMRKIEMSFLPDVTVLCEVCGGMRFNNETLQVTFKEKSIGDVLAMSIDDAATFFAAHRSIAHPLTLLQEVGLGYIKLGQQSPTLSGGEAQRIKLVTELARVRPSLAGERRRGGSTAPDHALYVLDEPTIGLHMDDVRKLIAVLHRLVDSGNTVIVIEHNLDILAESDWIIDLGPDGGDSGGQIVAQGTPEALCAKPGKSWTARYLKPFLERLA